MRSQNEYNSILACLIDFARFSLFLLRTHNGLARHDRFYLHHLCSPCESHPSCRIVSLFLRVQSVPKGQLGHVHVSLRHAGYSRILAMEQYRCAMDTSPMRSGSGLSVRTNSRLGNNLSQRLTPFSDHSVRLTSNSISASFSFSVVYAVYRSDWSLSMLCSL